jgi:hypothetical protein
MGTAGRVVLLSALIPLYYGVVVRAAGEPLNRGVLRLLLATRRVATRFSVADLDGASRLLLGGVLQLLFVAVLAVVTGAALPVATDPVLPVLGLVLGVAEAGAAGFAGFVVLRLVAPAGPAGSVPGLMAAARGGWIRFYLRTAVVAPRWWLVFATAVYVTGEELVFRGVVVGVCRDVYAPLAVTLSAGLFVLAQVFYTPGWRTAVFPMAGAAVVGVVHALLYLQVPDLLPLIVAHTVMFLVLVR